MSAGSLRREVLQSFKNIHRTRCYVFRGDEKTLERARKEINDGYKKNKNETDVEKIKELVKLANDIIHELKSNVIQLIEINPGRFQVQMRPELLELKPEEQKNKKCGGKK